MPPPTLPPAVAPLDPTRPATPQETIAAAQRRVNATLVRLDEALAGLQALAAQARALHDDHQSRLAALLGGRP